MKHHIARNTDLGVRIERVEETTQYQDDPSVLIDPHLPPGVPPHFLKVENGSLVELSEDEKAIRLEDLRKANKPKPMPLHEIQEHHHRLATLHDHLNALIPKLHETLKKAESTPAPTIEQLVEQNPPIDPDPSEMPIAAPTAPPQINLLGLTKKHYRQIAAISTVISIVVTAATHGLIAVWPRIIHFIHQILP